MGEYITIDKQEVKIGTCENMYYARLDQLEEVQALGLADVAEYLNPEYGYRYRFPFPEEDGLEIGEYDNYSKGLAVNLSYGSECHAPKLTEFLRGSDWEHRHVTQSQSVGHCYNFNVFIPCVLSADFAKANLKTSNGTPSDVIEIVQQKQVDGEIWVVVRCGYCGAAVRLDWEGASELCGVLRNYYVREHGFVRLDNKSRQEYYNTIAERIEGGYIKHNQFLKSA